MSLGMDVANNSEFGADLNFMEMRMSRSCYSLPSGLTSHLKVTDRVMIGIH